MKIYGIFISDKNRLNDIMNDDVLKILKSTHAKQGLLRVVDLKKYIAVFAFKDPTDRDRCAEELTKRNIIFDTRDDGYI